MALKEDDKACVLNEEALKYVLGLIKILSNVSDAIDDINLRTDGTFSSVKINQLLTALKDECDDYTNEQVKKVNKPKGVICDEKPTFSDGTITYKQNGEIKTTLETNLLFYYNSNGVLNQTLFIDGVELTINNTSGVDFTDYVNKNTDLANGYTGNEINKTKVTTIKELDDLLSLIDIKKINVTDVIDDWLHIDTDKPVSARVANELYRLIDNIETSISGSVMVKKEFENVTANTENRFSSPVSLKGGYVSAVYTMEAGITNITGTVKTFENNTKQDFTNNEEVIVDNNGGKIKDDYNYKAIFNDTDNLFETLLDINDFVSLNSFESEVVR